MNKTKIGLLLLSPFMIMCLIVIGESVLSTLGSYINNFLAFPLEKKFRLIAAVVIMIMTITGFIFLFYGLEEELEAIRKSEESK